MFRGLASKRHRAHLAFELTLLVGAPLAVHAFLGTFTRYMADDYCVAAVARDQGFWGAQSYWYLNWSGRFSYTFATGVALLFGAGEAAWQPALLLLAWAAALTFALAGLPLATDRRWRWGTAFVLALFLIGLTLSAIPNVAQSLYWRNSALTYQLPLVVGALLAGLILRARRWPALVAIALTAFVGAGFAEIYSVTQAAALAMALGLALLWTWRARPASTDPRLWACAAALAGSMVGLTVVALSPGTEARQATFGAPPSLGLLIYNTVQYALWFLRDAFTRRGAVWLAAVVGPALFAFGLSLTGRGIAIWPRRSLAGALITLPILTYLLLVAAYVPAFYALRYLPPDRVLIVQWFVLLILSGILGWLAGQGIHGFLLARGVVAEGGSPQEKGGHYHSFGYFAPVLLTVGAVLVMLPGLWSAGTMLGGRDEARSFAATWDAYDRLLRSATGPVTLAQLDNPGGIENLSQDPTFWSNRCAANYYGVEIEALAPPPEATRKELQAMTKVDAQFGEVARLRGYSFALGPSGTEVVVTLYWQPLALTDQPYSVFVHLLSPNGSIAQADGYPVFGTYPTTRWILLRPFGDVYTLILPADTPRTRLRLIAGLYDLETLERLPVTGWDANPDGEDWVELGSYLPAN